MALPTIMIEDYKQMLGNALGTSSWITVDQQMISNFAGLTMDHNFIHTDAARTRMETPFDGTIAHGFLTVSLLSAMAQEVMPDLKGVKVIANYGLNRLRFLAPVPSGGRIRGTFKLIDLNRRKPGQWLATHDVSVEIEGGKKPALKAQWLSLIFRDA